MRCTLNKYFDNGIETKSAPCPTYIMYVHVRYINNNNKNITENDKNFNSVVKLYTQIEWICDHQI